MSEARFTPALKQKLEVLEGDRPPASMHALRKKDFAQYRQAILDNIESLRITLGEIRDAGDRADEARAQADAAVALAQSIWDDILSDFWEPLSELVDKNTDDLVAALPLLRTNEDALQDIAAFLAENAALQFATEEKITKAGILVNEETGVVELTALEATETTISDLQAKLDAASNEITLRATYADVDQAIANATLDPADLGVLVGMSGRISDAEVSLSAMLGTVEIGTETLEWHGREVTFSQIALDLNSIEDTLTTKVSKDFFGTDMERFTSVETALSAFDGAQLQRTLYDIQREKIRLEEQAFASLQALLDAYERDTTLSEQIAYVNEDLVARVESETEVTSSRVFEMASIVDDTRATLQEVSEARVEDNQAFVERFDIIEAQFDPEKPDSAIARIEEVERVKVDADGAQAEAGTLLAAALLPDGSISNAIQTAVEGIGPIPADVSALVQNILALDVSTEYAFGGWLQQAVTAFGSMEAFVQLTADAYTSVNNAQSTYVLRQIAGDVSGRVEAVAFDNPLGPPASNILISYDYIDLEGAVRAQDLTVTDFSGNLIPNGNMRFGDFRSWSNVSSTFAIAERDGNSPNPALSGMVARYAVEMPSHTNPPFEQAVLFDYDDIPIEAGGTYSMSFDTAVSFGSSGVVLFMRIEFQDEAGNSVGGANLEINRSSSDNLGWHRSERRITVPPQGVRARMVLRRRDGGIGNGYATNMRLTRVADAKTVITPNSVTTDLVDVEQLAASTAFVTELFANNLFIIDTAQIGRNAVTVGKAYSWGRGRRRGGNGTYQHFCQLGIVIDNSAHVSVAFNCKQGFSDGGQFWVFRMECVPADTTWDGPFDPSGRLIFEWSGQGVIDLVSTSNAVRLQPGSYLFKVFWYGANDKVSVTAPTLNLLATMR